MQLCTFEKKFRGPMGVPCVYPPDAAKNSVRFPPVELHIPRTQRSQVHSNVNTKVHQCHRHPPVGAMHLAQFFLLPTLDWAAAQKLNSHWSFQDSRDSGIPSPIQAAEEDCVVEMLGRMPELPPIIDLISAVQKCKKEKILVHAKNVHAHIRDLGLEIHDSVGNYIVPMFVECGSMSDARQVFDRLARRNERSWTSLISGYVECGQVQQALNLYQRMQEDSVCPSCYTLTALVKSCARINDVERGQDLHAQIVNKGFDRDVFSGSSLVDMYAKCGSMREARQVFDNLSFRTVVSWTALIAGYAEHGLGDEALACFEQMRLEGVSPDATTFVCVLKACSSVGLVCKGREIHTNIALKGLEKDVFVGNILVDMYAKCGFLVEAQEISDKHPGRNIVSWTALIAGYAEHGPGEEALKCFKKMKLEGIFPDAVTFASILKACGSIGAIERGREIHADIPQKDLELYFFLGNSVVDMYAKCGSLVEAHTVFDKLQFRNIVPWNALIAGYAEHGSSQQVLKCVEHMQLEGVSLDAGTYVSMLKACGSIGSIGKGQELHVDIALKGFERDLSVGNTLVDMYAKQGAVAEAHQVFNKLPVQDVVSWTALIAGYTEEGRGQEALACFDWMQLEGVSPNVITFVCILKSCGNLGAIGKGQEVHIDVTQKGFERDISICNTLIDMYAKYGSLLDAQEVFHKLPMRDVVSWNAMIKGYGMNHKGDMAVQCFEEMQGQGVKPDDVTFTCVLFACSRAKLLRKGQDVFNMMKEEYSIAPTIDHYTCMVDLHAKSGCLSEVEEFLDSVSSPSTWTALLTACKIHGEIDIGRRCFQQLVQMNPERAAPYVLMAKTYASAGMWNDAHKIEELRKLAGAKKKLASALIEVNKEVHEFVVGDDQSQEISAMLEILSSRIKNEGHVPTVNLDSTSI